MTKAKAGKQLLPTLPHFHQIPLATQPGTPNKANGTTRLVTLMSNCN